ncbi:MAG: alpha/beta fold hydrolase [Halobacteriota archaeon]
MDKKSGLLVICATILVLIFVGTASATNRSVDGSGGADFSVIQEAINNASMGDTILVHSGVYYENVYVNKSVTLKGIGYPVVAANGSGSAITLNADGITLEGFNATNSGSMWECAGINVISGNNTITGNNVRNNEYGGIYLADSSNNNSITGNTFVNNGLRISNSYQNTVEGNIVNGKHLVYLEDASDYTVKDAGQVILVNCTNITVENLDLSNTDVGIELWKTENSRISNNNVRNNNCGSISLSDSSNNSITGNNVSNNNGDAISITDSSNNTIAGNNASSNSNVGIYLSGDSSNNVITGNNVRNNSNVGIWLSSFVLFPFNNTITGNNVHNNYGGIYLSRSSNNSITGNNVRDNNDDGISLSRSTNNAISGNTFVNDGLSVDDSYQNTVEENKVNGKPLVYLEDASDYTVEDAGQVILVNCTNITVENLDLANTSVGVELWKTEDSKVLNNTVSNNGNGISLYRSSNNSITGNNVRSNSIGGISLWNSCNNTITGNNVCNNSNGGISLWNSCNNNTITGNTFVNCGLFVFEHYQNAVGDNTVNGKPLVYLVDASDYTVRDAGQVILVNCNNITVEGLDLSNTSVGIELWKTEDSKVLNNTVSNDSNTGIILSDSSNNTITGNNVRNNSNGDIDLSDSSNNSIYLNNFINNTDSVDSYASTNIWNSPEEITYTYNRTTYASYLGNYWADYKGRADANGIGNTPYSIDPEKDDCDLYPLMTPFENYISSEFETEVAATANMETIAKTFVTILTESEFEKAHALFNKDMAEAVPVNKLNATWNGLIDQYGAFTGIENIRSAKEKGYETVFVTCNFSKTFLDAKIVFDIHEKIAGLFFLPIYGPPEYVDPDSFTESECTVGTGKWKLPGTLTIPKGEGPFYAVVLVAGSGPEDMNETIGPNEPFKDLAWGLATEGIAVLRYDKRTYRYPQECIAMIKNDNFTVNDETIDDAIAAVDLLRETERIDPDNISVLGHSLGGYLAPRIAARNENISGVILLAAPARSLPDLIIEQTEYLASLDGTTDDKEAKSLEEVKEQATKVKELNISKGEILFGAPESYWADLSDYDPVNVARNLSRPILILQGERDYHVTMVDYEMWIKGLTGKNNVCFKNILYSDFNHLFMAVPGTGKATPADLFRPGHVALIVIDNVADWIIYESKRK